MAQGNGEDELPEVVFACARVSRVDFGQVCLLIIRFACPVCGMHAR